MTLAVLSGFALALAAPWAVRLLGDRAGRYLAALPAALAAYWAVRGPAIASGGVALASREWIPSLGMTLSFRLDGLSLIFALLISGIGALVIIYAGGYLRGHDLLGRFYAYLLMFMASMQGLVLADNVVTLFVFWELTSVSSYLLIGFDHDRSEARAAALQALLVTGAGGLVLLAGLILLGQAGGSFELTALLQRGETVRAHALYPWVAGFVLIGAFTKSAQVPFHFWLPNAMEAPAPVSAYLHSATMVKAGVYLLARLSPILGGTGAWAATLTPVGAATMVVGAVLAVRETDLKRILAYSTVSALGTLTALLGGASPEGASAAMGFLLAHSLYKGALFLVVGAVDHETGARDVTALAGLRSAMPQTAVAAGLAALAMAGLPPTLGFLAKEMLYETSLRLPGGGWLVGVAFAASTMLVAVAAIVGIGPFVGARASTPRHAHEVPLDLRLGPLLLGALGAMLGPASGWIGRVVVGPAASAIAGDAVGVPLALWHGFTPALGLSALTVLCGAALFVWRHPVRLVLRRLDTVARWSPAAWYGAALTVLNATARLQTRVLQSGYLRVYLLTIITVTVGLAGFAMWGRVEIRPAGLPHVRSYEWVVAAVILLAAVAATRASSRLAAVAALGAVGYGVALVFIIYGAPDLAMTQFAIETLTVILFVLVLYRLPRFARYSGTAARVRDAVFAVAAGTLMALLVLAVTQSPAQRVASEFFAEASVSQAHGRNVVNVILVDFRALDTLGEITVLAVAAAGVYALLRLRPEGT
ncbi:MAG: putative monovalent cation/H+ antiporter subunit A [Armatimonadota bacterium]|nr:putative monovalent cation/H+ antiporter subunit A [Armatimonadota bacterium]